jgi:hypothetical protein
MTDETKVLIEISDPDDLTDFGREQVAKWLENQAKLLREKGSTYVRKNWHAYFMLMNPGLILAKMKEEDKQ